MSDNAQKKSSSTLPHKIVAAGVLVVAGLALWQTLVIPKAALYAKVGPDVFPKIVTGFLFACGIGLVLDAFKGGWAGDQDGTLTEWGSLGYVALGLLVNAALIEHIGFILASTIMFGLIARGFGSTQWMRDAAIGFALAIISFVGFDRVLGYKIGSGLIESLI